jgi:hypothetical protein
MDYTLHHKAKAASPNRSGKSVLSAIMNRSKEIIERRVPIKYRIKKVRLSEFNRTRARIQQVSFSQNCISFSLQASPA